MHIILTWCLPVGTCSPQRTATEFCALRILKPEMLKKNLLWNGEANSEKACFRLQKDQTDDSQRTKSGIQTTKADW